MLSAKIIKAINKKYPSIKESTLQKKFRIYVESVTEAYSYAIMYHSAFSKIHNGQFQLSLTEISRGVGDFRKGKEIKRINVIFSEFCPLFTVTVEGNQFNKKLSQVALTKFGKRVIEEEMKMVPMKEQNKYLVKAANVKKICKEAGMKVDTYIHTPIDIKSLTGYIERQTEKLSSSDYSENIKTAIKGEVLLAMNIKAVAEQHDNHLPQYISVADSGRFYYKGLNLQNCPKLLRTAAIGKCYQYDINASSFAIMLNEAVRIEMERLGKSKDEVEKSFSIIVCYVKNRAGERQQVGSDVNGKIYELNKTDKYANEIRQVNIGQIKQAFTAIGFGARAVDSCWLENGQIKKGALSAIFGNRAITNIFLNHDIVKKFILQLKSMNEVIFDHYEQYNFEAVKDFPFIGEVTKAKVLAHIYQSLEADILKTLINGYKQSDGTIKVLCPDLYVLIHDGFITKKEMTANQKELLQIATRNQYLYFSKDEYGAWQPKEVLTLEQIKFEKNHREHIIKEEEKAAEYHSPSGYTTPVKSFYSDKEKKVKEIQLADAAIREEVKRKSPGVDYQRPVART